MEISFLLSSVLLLLFSLLALFDGVFLHIIKYRLYAISESKFEHFTHTLRALLFVGILSTVYLNIENNTLFKLGVIFIALDLITLFIDAFVEKDSRMFMGGLPRWEYIIHLFVNGFHFAGIAILFIIKIRLNENGFYLVSNFDGYKNFELFQWFSVNMLPGAIIISLMHVLVYFKKIDYLLVKYYFKFQSKFNCC